MANSDEQGPHKGQGGHGDVGATPAALPEQLIEGRRGNTQEWDVGTPPSREIVIGDGGVAEVGATPEPEVSVELEPDGEPAGESNGRERASAPDASQVGMAPEGPKPLVETPTAPLPMDDSARENTGEIDIEDAEELAEFEEMMAASAEAGPRARDVASRTPRPVTPPPVTPPPVHTGAAVASALRAPPPVPLNPPSNEGPRVPPIPVSAIDSALRTASEWAEPLSERPRRKRAKPWYEEVFDEDYLRTLPFMTAEQTLREVNFIHDCLNPPQGGSLLDVGCGYGRHAIELAQRGLLVTGIDLSLPLLIRAADESQRRSLNVNFVHADMRELSFDSQFDGAYCMLSSFGYFDEETNLKVASGIYRALKPGGRFLLDTLNRDYIVTDLPTRVWWEGDGCVVLEEVDFNFHTSRVGIRRSIVFSEGRQLEQDISIRAYSLHELGRLMRQAGFRVVEVSGGLATPGRFFGATSRNLIVVCEKPPH